MNRGNFYIQNRIIWQIAIAVKTDSTTKRHPFVFATPLDTLNPVFITLRDMEMTKREFINYNYPIRTSDRIVI